MKETELFENEHIEYLKPSFGLVVSPAHTFGTDAVLLARFAAPKRSTLACDLGTGCGIIPMLWLADGLCRRVDGVEIQEAGCNQFARSIAANGLEEIAFAHLANLKALDTVLPCESYDLVTMNPPYKAEHTGILSDSAHEKIARHETACTLADISAAAARLLKYGGRFCLCIRPERLFETMQAMANVKIEPKKLRLVSKNPNSAPWLCLLEGRKGGKRGLQVQNGLYVYDENGNLSAEMRRIYGAYKEEGQR
ncbi:MAG: tRNA1(Val) (adenine(37)-N6)-methyltransferase [Candidatus Fimenecus sp.]